MRVLHRLALVAFVLCIVVHHSVARAQSEAPSASALAAGRDQFNVGVSRARARDWEAARDAFQRSYDLSRRAIVLINLAAAQTHLGQLVEASESYRRFLSEADLDQRASREAAVTGALGDLAARLPRVRIEVTGLTQGDRIVLDHDVLPAAGLGTAVPVDPGDHVVVVTRAGVELSRQRFAGNEGETAEVRLTLGSGGPIPSTQASLVGSVLPAAEPEPSSGSTILVSPTHRTDPSDEHSSSVFASPWLWVGVGAVAVAVVVIVVATSSGTSAAFNGNFPPGHWVAN